MFDVSEMSVTELLFSPPLSDAVSLLIIIDAPCASLNENSDDDFIDLLSTFKLLPFRSPRILTALRLYENFSMI